MNSHAIPLFLYKKKSHPPFRGVTRGSSPSENKKFIKRTLGGVEHPEGGLEGKSLSVHDNGNETADGNQMS